MRVFDIDVSETPGRYVGPDWKDAWLGQLQKRHGKWMHYMLLQRALAQFKENVQRTVQVWVKKSMVDKDVIDCDEADKEEEQASQVVTVTDDPHGRYCNERQARVILHELEDGCLGKRMVIVTMASDTTYCKGRRKLNISAQCTSYAA